MKPRHPGDRKSRIYDETVEQIKRETMRRTLIFAGVCVGTFVACYVLAYLTLGA